MKKNRFTLLTRAVPLIVCLLVVALSVPAFAQTTICEARLAGGGQNPLYANSGGAVTSAKSTAAGLSGTGCYYAGQTTPAKTGTWSFTPTQSGYYNVTGTWPVNAYAADVPAPVWLVDSEGADVSIGLVQTAGGNAWNTLATGVQLSPGVTYTVMLSTTPDSVSGKRTFFDSVKWTYVKTNTPTALTATGREDETAVDLAWTAPDPAPATYTIERKAGSGGTYAEIATDVLASPYADTTGDCGINYFYRVKAIDAGAIVSGWSNEDDAMRCLDAAPGKATEPSPADLATLVHTDIANLSWTADPGATSHDVWLGKTSGGMIEVSAAQAGTTYALSTLDANQDYFWRIDETNLTGTTTGDVWTFKTGVSLTVIAIRKAAAGNLSDELSAVREWSTTTWHEAGTAIGFTVAPNEGYTWKWWTKNIDGTKSTWVDPPYDATWSDENQVLGQGDPVTAPYYVGSGPLNDILYAYFEAPQFTVSLTANPTAGQTSLTAHNNTWPTASTYEEGDSAHLQTTPATGYLFAGWVSDQAGVFADAFAADTTYTFTAANTAITAYYAHAVTNLVDTDPLSIYCATGNTTPTFDNSSNVQVNVGAYTNTNNAWWSRIVCDFPATIPDLALRNGLGKLAVHHVFASSYSSTLTLQVSAYPITTAWTDGMTAGATWLTTDHTALWTTPGGDMGASLGTQPMYGTVDEWKIYPLATGTDYRALFAEGIELKGDVEGNIAYRKGVGKDVTLNFFYDPPTGANSGVIKDLAYLGFYPQGVAADHQARIDTDQVAGTYNLVPVDVTTLAPRIGNTLGTKTWALGSSATDVIDLLGTDFYNNAGNVNGVTYCATYVNNPGAAKTYYIGLGSDDFSKTWLDTSARASKLVAEGARADAAFQGPFTLNTGWHRLIAKVENGTGAHGLYLRLANADRTALTGIETLTFATTDATAPTNPTSVTVGGTWDVPTFLLAGADDPQGTGEGVSGVRGFKVYFGTNPAGVPSAFQTSWTVSPGTQTPGTYYLRVSTVDVALNESATVADVSTYECEEPPPSHVDTYGLNSRAVHDAIMVPATAAGKKFTVWGKVTFIDVDSFTVDDGTGLAVKVIKTAHGLASDDYVAARGTLNVSDPENPVLTAEKIEKY